MVDDGSQVFIHCVVDCGIVAVLLLCCRLGFLGGEVDAVLPAGIFFRGRALVVAAFFNRGNAAGEAAGLRALGTGNNFVFELGQGAQQLAGFKWLDDKSIGPGSFGLFRLERLQLADGQQHRNARRLARLFEPLADFQPAVAGHVDVEHDQIRLQLGDLLQRGRAVIDGDDFVARVREDLPPHILSGNAVIGEQYLPGQRFL